MNPRSLIFAAIVVAALPAIGQSSKSDLAASTERQLPALTDTYKHLHRNPELSHHDRFRCAVEEREEAVAVGPELAAAKAIDHGPDPLVVLAQQPRPLRIADALEHRRRVADVGEHHRREHARADVLGRFSVCMTTLPRASSSALSSHRHCTGSTVRATPVSTAISANSSVCTSKKGARWNPVGTRYCSR